MKCQAVTSDNESEVDVFPPLPKLPESKLTAAYFLVAHRGHSDTFAGMTIVERCQTAS